MVVTSENPEREKQEKVLWGAHSCLLEEERWDHSSDSRKSESGKVTQRVLFETLSCVRFLLWPEFSAGQNTERVAIPLSRESSQTPGINWGLALQAYSLPWATREVHSYSKCTEFLLCDSESLFIFKYMNNFSNQGRRFNLDLSSRLFIFTSVSSCPCSFFYC